MCTNHPSLTHKTVKGKEPRSGRVLSLFFCHAIGFSVLVFRRFGIPSYALPPPKNINTAISAHFPVSLRGRQQTQFKLVLSDTYLLQHLFPLNAHISPICIRLSEDNRRIRAKSEHFPSEGKYAYSSHRILVPRGDEFGVFL